MKVSKFAILPLAPEDVGDVVCISDDCGLSPWSVQDYGAEMKRNDSTLIKLASEWGETVGFLVGRRVPSASSETQLDAEIYNIGVKAAFQRSGCGTLLLSEFLDMCIVYGVHTVWLDVRISNKTAVSFYKRFGFLEQAVRTRFYSDPVEDGVVMSLVVGQAESLIRRSHA